MSPFVAMKNRFGTTRFPSAIKPLCYVSTIFGLTSFSSVKEELQPRKCGAFLTLRMWSCVCITVYVASGCTALFNDIVYAKPGTPGKIIIINALYTISLYLTSVACLCLCGVFRRHLLSDIIDNLELTTKKFMTTIDKRIAYRTSITIVLLEIIVFGVSSFVDVMFVYRRCNGTFKECLLSVLESLSGVCNSLIIVQFVTLILILREKYKYVNQILVKSAEDALKRPMMTFQNCGLQELISVDTCITKHRTSKNLLSQNQVYNCRVIMTRLIYVSGLICSYYGFPILLATFWIFINIVFVLYLLFYDLSTILQVNNDLFKYVYSLECLSWCAYFAMLITVMTWSCHLISEEANMTMCHVQNALLHPNLGQDTIEELGKFCYQLSNMKTEITASGFFVLNLEFLYGFFGVTFAYFVIMFQLN